MRHPGWDVGTENGHYIKIKGIQCGLQVTIYQQGITNIPIP